MRDPKSRAEIVRGVAEWAGAAALAANHPKLAASKVGVFFCFKLERGSMGRALVNEDVGQVFRPTNEASLPPNTPVLRLHGPQAAARAAYSVAREAQASGFPAETPATSAEEAWREVRWGGAEEARKKKRRKALFLVLIAF